MSVIEEVDVAYPIILGPDGRVMDGMHRIARAMLEGKSTIPAVRLERLPEPDYCNCRPADLPYD
jgi:ParB-like chromosome segregation protein Spo0J